MRTMVGALALVLAAVSTVQAASEWGIEHEKIVRFEAKVVDVLCELTGDCPADCGAGERQLGLVRDDGVLVLAVKNFDPFAGTTHDLAPFCGQRITADGLMIDDPLMPLFALHFKRLAPDGEWAKANWFTRDWAQTHGGTHKRASQWFRKDSAVRSHIAKFGVFGLPGVEPEE